MRLGTHTHTHTQNHNHQMANHKWHRTQQVLGISSITSQILHEVAPNRTRQGEGVCKGRGRGGGGGAKTKHQTSQEKKKLVLEHASSHCWG